MSRKVTLPLTATIPPGASVRVSAKPQSTFRPERLVVSPQSFPLSLARRMWTWPICAIGYRIGRAHRALAKLLHVDLWAPRTRREDVSLAYARLHDDTVSWSEDGPFVLIPLPRKRRERLLAPLGRIGRWLSQTRLRWQEGQLCTLRIINITISEQPQLSAHLLADIFSGTLGTFVNFSGPWCSAGHEIEVDIHNGNRRECHLVMSFIGTAKVSQAPRSQD